MGASLHTHMTPNATQRTGFWTVTGAASIHAALADASNATYASQNLGGTGSPHFSLEMNNPAAMPANAQVKFLRLIISASMTPALYGYLRVDVVVPNVGAIPVQFANIPGTGVALTVDLATRPGGGPWLESDLANLLVNAAGPVTNATVTIYAMAVQAWINRAPITTPTGPGTVTTVSGPGEPHLTWSYSDTETDVQEWVQVRLFSGGTAVAAPGEEVARLLSDTGAIQYAGTSIEANVWPNGDYRWAVRAKDAGSGPYDYGPWGQATITFALPTPADPTVLVWPDPINNRYLIHMTAGAGPNPTERFEVQRSNDGGLNWSWVRGSLLGLLNTGGTVAIYDYEAVRMARPATAGSQASIGYNEPVGYNAALGYNAETLVAATGPPNVVRIRVRATRVLNGVTLYSNWVTIMPESLLSDRRTWLKHPYDSSKSVAMSGALAHMATTAEEDMGILRGANRADHVVFGSVVSMEKGELEIIFPGDTAWKAFRDLHRRSDGSAAVPLLLQTCFGDTTLEQMWVRLGPTRSVTRVTHSGQHDLQYRRVKVGFVETLRPRTIA